MFQMHFTHVLDASCMHSGHIPCLAKKGMEVNYSKSCCSFTEKFALAWMCFMSIPDAFCACIPGMCKHYLVINLLRRKILIKIGPISYMVGVPNGLGASTIVNS